MPKLVVWVPFNKHGYVKASIDVPVCADGSTLSLKSLASSGREFLSCKLLSNNKSIEVAVGSILEFDQTHDHCLADLTTLRQVNDAAVLNSVYSRYKRGKLSLIASPALHLAVHPCSGRLDADGILGDISDYEKIHPKDKHAHMFHIVDSCLSVSSGISGATPPSDCVVVMGASASGKTQACRRLLQYTLSRYSSPSGGGVCWERALRMSLLLDAFGNAATPANADSSRYSSVVCVSMQPTGARGELTCRATSVFAFGLEAARVVSVGTAVGGGRNFHVLHQLVCGLEKSQLSKLLLSANPTQHRFLGKQCGLTSVTAAVLQQSVRGDALRFQATRAALTHATAHLAATYSDPSFEVLRLLACVLHIGNMLFRSKHDGMTIDDVEDDQSPCEIVKSKYFYFIEETLGLSTESMRTGGGTFEQALTSRSMSISSSGRSSLFTVELTAQKTFKIASALAMELYVRMFQWIAGRWSNDGPGEQGASVLNIMDLGSCVGSYSNDRYLDTFHLFLNNYGSEKLRSHYLSDLFDAELRAYQEDGLQVPELDDANSTLAKAGGGAIAVLEGAGAARGVFTVLESCVGAKDGVEGPNAASHFVAALAVKVGPSGLLTRESQSVTTVGMSGGPSGLKHGAPRGSSSFEFGVRHFTGDVFYNAEGFLSANIAGDFAHPANKPMKLLVDMLKRSTSPLVRELFGAADGMDVDQVSPAGTDAVGVGLQSHSSDGLGRHATTTATRRLSMAVQAGKPIGRESSGGGDAGAPAGVSACRPVTLGAGQAGQYRQCLEKTLTTIRASQYVKYLLCIKPNREYFEPLPVGPTAATPDSVVFDRELVLEQLRQHRVPAYAQLRGDGPGCFPVRMTHAQLHDELIAADLYSGSGVDVPALMGSRAAGQAQCRKWVNLLFNEAVDAGSWREGRERVFMKSSVFESLRLYMKRNIIVSLQRIWRGVLVRLKLYKYISGVCALQRLVRRRQFFQRYRFGIRCGVVKLQSLVRMYRILKKVLEVRHESLRHKSALQLQRMYRMYRAQMRVMLLLLYRQVAFVFNRWRLKRRLRFRAAAALIKTALTRREWREQFRRVLDAAHVINRCGNARSCRASFLKLRAHALKVQQRWRGFYIRKQAEAIVALIRVEKVLRKELVAAVVWNDLSKLRALFSDPQYATALQRGEVDAGAREKDSLGGSPLTHLAVDNCHKQSRDVASDSLAVLAYLLESHRDTVDLTAVDSLGRTMFHRLVTEQYTCGGGPARADMRLWTYLLRKVPSEVLLQEDVHGATVLSSLEAEQRTSTRPMPPAEFSALHKLLCHYVDDQPVKRREARLVRRSWYVTSRFEAQNQGKAKKVKAHEYKPTHSKPFRPPSKQKPAGFSGKSAVSSCVSSPPQSAPPRLATSQQPFAGMNADVEEPEAPATVLVVPLSTTANMKAKSKRKSVFAWASGAPDASIASSPAPTTVAIVPASLEVAPVVETPPSVSESEPTSPVRVSALSSKLFGMLTVEEDEDEGGFFSSQPFSLASPVVMSPKSEAPESSQLLSPAEAVARALKDVDVVDADFEADSALTLRERREERHRRMRAARDAGATEKKLIAMALASGGNGRGRPKHSPGQDTREGFAVTSVPFANVSAEVEESAPKTRVVRKHDPGYHPMLNVFHARDFV